MPRRRYLDRGRPLPCTSIDHSRWPAPSNSAGNQRVVIGPRFASRLELLHHTVKSAMARRFRGLTENGFAYVIDTSRNGAGPALTPRQLRCPSGRSPWAHRPLPSNRGRDAYLWIKRPQEIGRSLRSQGASGGSVRYAAIDLAHNAGRDLTRRPASVRPLSRRFEARSPLP